MTTAESIWSASRVIRRAARPSCFVKQRLRHQALFSTSQRAEQEYEGVERPSANNEAGQVHAKGPKPPHMRINAALLRDSCQCSSCIDPSTRQKTFQTTSIQSDISPRSYEQLADGSWKYVWKGEEGRGESDHTSIYPKDFLWKFWPPSAKTSPSRRPFALTRPRCWNATRIKAELKYSNYEAYMNSDQELARGLYQLSVHGMLFIRGVPSSEKAVEDIALRIGNIRDTFYGRTWDVKSVPDAKNIAYTNQNLGLHMDLLYMSDPPGLQLLHCLKNSCEGGASIFCDAFNAASRLTREEIKLLKSNRLTYHYHNDGQHYRYSHPIIQRNDNKIKVVKHGAGESDPKLTQELKAINYSPPFQAPMLSIVSPAHDAEFLKAFRRFANSVEDERNLFEYRLQEGECVLFNNRRILHGRRAFDMEGGERWLKGAYVDTDVFESRYRVLKESFGTNSLFRDTVSAERVVDHEELKKKKLPVEKSSAVSDEEVAKQE